VLAALAIWAPFERKASIGTELASFNGVIKQHEEDAKKNAAAVQQVADTLAKTEAKVVTVTEKVYAAPVIRDCAQSPACGSRARTRNWSPVTPITTRSRPSGCR